VSATHSYAIALGSNRRHVRYGRPEAVVRAAVHALEQFGSVTAMSGIHRTDPIGPAGRRFANAALTLETALEPLSLLIALKAVERSFGRRRGRRWGPRVLDLDIILWSGGAFASPPLVIPHLQMRRRGFVLLPLAEVAPDWPVTREGRRVRHLAARFAAKGKAG
jgi:2-amino-4-hydroxy-6-hydroxymethyldihydropteridine diphosphokinase